MGINSCGTTLIDNGTFENIGAVIVLPSAELIAKKTDIRATKSMATFSKALNDEELKEFLKSQSINEKKEKESIVF